MKRFLELVALIGIFAGLLLFNRYAVGLDQVAKNSASDYFIQRAIMALWLALGGFLYELPRIYEESFRHGTRFSFNWLSLVIFGVPGLILALLPLFVSMFKMPVPAFLLLPNALPAEVLGAFLVGLAVGKAFTREEYRVF